MLVDKSNIIGVNRGMENNHTPISRAISIAGSEAKLGRAAGVSQNAIWQAKKKGRVSAELAIKIEKATAGLVTRLELRPDLFGTD